MEQCEKERFVLEYFGLSEANENTPINTDFGQLVNLLYMWYESHPSAEKEYQP